jgi:hypothetical protein
MDTQTTTQRFTLDEAKAQEWLQRAVAAYERTLYGDDPVTGEILPEITEDWQPGDCDSDIDICNLVRDAILAGIITRPANGEIDFEYIHDPDEDWYRFLVGFWPGLAVASPVTEMRKLADPCVTGADAALAILREAVTTANGVLDGLDEYVASRASTVLADEWTVNGEQLPGTDEEDPECE